jgi:hypothetical protein
MAIPSFLSEFPPVSTEAWLFGRFGVEKQREALVEKSRAAT